MLVAGAITYAEQRTFLYERVDAQARGAPVLLARELEGDGGRRGPGGRRRPRPGGNGPLGLPPGTYGELRDALGRRCSATLPVGSGDHRQARRCPRACRSGG